MVTQFIAVTTRTPSSVLTLTWIGVQTPMHGCCGDCPIPRCHTDLIQRFSQRHQQRKYVRDITNGRLRGGVFASVPELVKAIGGTSLTTIPIQKLQYQSKNVNTNPNTFSRTNSACDILENLMRGNSD